MKQKLDDDIIVSFDAAAFVKANVAVMTDALHGRLTPAEARAISAEHSRVLKIAEQIFKLGQMSKRIR